MNHINNTPPPSFLGTSDAAKSVRTTDSINSDNSIKGNLFARCSLILISTYNIMSQNLADISNYVLEPDEQEANSLANQIKSIKFKTGTAPAVQAYNNKMNTKSTWIQSLIKNQQSQQGQDMQLGSSVSQNCQQLSGLINTLTSTWGAITNLVSKAG